MLKTQLKTHEKNYDMFDSYEIILKSLKKTNEITTFKSSNPSEKFGLISAPGLA